MRGWAETVKLEDRHDTGSGAGVKIAAQGIN
jgi:hypothetical protein